MTWTADLETHLLFFGLLAYLLANVVMGGIFGQRLLTRLAADPVRRKRFYRRYLIDAWGLAGLAALIVFLSDDLSAVDVGWAWPSGDGVAYLLTAVFVTSFAIGGVGARLRMRRGHVLPGRARLSTLLPRTSRGRWFAAGFAFTAGITEEVIYRGLLIGAGTDVYHLPVALAVLVSAAIFVAAHAYQGRTAMLGIVLLTSLLTTIYLLSGSLLLVIVLHVCVDVVALLLIPAFSSAPAQAREPATGPNGSAGGHRTQGEVTVARDAASGAARTVLPSAGPLGTSGRTASSLAIRPATPEGPPR